MKYEKVEKEGGTIDKKDEDKFIENSDGLKILSGLIKGTYLITLKQESTNSTIIYKLMQTGKAITLMRLFDKRYSLSHVFKKTKPEKYQ